jgi:hypothetical protein
MIPNGKSRMTKLVMAFLIAGGVSLVGTGQALAKKVVVRPGDRVVYRANGSRVYEEPYPYRWTPPARWQGPPPWAASWYRSRHWRDRDDWREGRNNHWRWERRARD